MPIICFITIQTLAITDIYNSLFYISDWSHFLQTFICIQPTLFSESLLLQTKNIPSPHRSRLHVSADHYCLPTFKHGVRTTQNLNTSESTTVWHRDQWHVLSHPKIPRRMWRVFTRNAHPCRYSDSQKPPDRLWKRNWKLAKLSDFKHSVPWDN